jgi:hypothetical protein
MKIFLLVLITFLPLHAMSEGYTFKVDDLEGEILSFGLIPEQAQVVMRCQFIKNGRPTKYTEKRPYTTLEILEQNEKFSITKIRMKKAAIWDFLPGFKIHNCSFNLLLLMKNTKTRGTYLGDFIQLGKKVGQMSKEEIEDITDTRFASETLSSKWNRMILTIKNVNNRPTVIMDHQ